MRPKKKVCICYQHGCVRRKIDAQLIYDYFILNGWRIIKSLSRADLIIVSTCAFDKIREDAAIETVTQIKKKNATAKIIVAGCLGGINRERLSGLGEFIVISPPTLSELDKIINAKISIKELEDPVALNAFRAGKICDFSLTVPPFRQFINAFRSLKRKVISILACKGFKKHYSGYDFFNIMYSPNTKLIRISEGCINNCSYCAIKYAIGNLRSKPVKNIIKEFDYAIKKKYRRVCLVAADVGSYGIDIQTNIINLLKAMLGRKGACQIMLFDVNMSWLIKYSADFFDILKKYPGKIDSILCPIQSGSDRILTLMKRKYKIMQVIDCLKKIKEISPEIKLITDIMVGFPGETEEDFLKTVELIKTIKFDKMQVFKYADRIRTEAVGLPNKIPEDVKEKNCIRINNFTALSNNELQ